MAEAVGGQTSEVKGRVSFSIRRSGCPERGLRRIVKTLQSAETFEQKYKRIPNKCVRCLMGRRYTVQEIVNKFDDLCPRIHRTS